MKKRNYGLFCPFQLPNFHGDQKKTDREMQTNGNIKTKIAPLLSFTPAEDYHQKYLLKQHSLKREILRFYPASKDLIDSTTAARLNAYVGGNDTKVQLSREIKNLGLSKKGKAILRDLVQK